MTLSTPRDRATMANLVVSLGIVLGMTIEKEKLFLVYQSVIFHLMYSDMHSKMNLHKP
jgi:hypothetical protein